jgi:hypothetical protein
MAKNYKAKLFYEEKQREHYEKFGCFFDTNCKMGEIIEEFHKRELNELVLYKFLYNCSVCESAASTMSSHLTEEGAKQALKTHKNKLRREWIDRNKEIREDVDLTEEQKEYYIDKKFGDDKWWGIEEVKIQQ